VRIYLAKWAARQSTGTSTARHGTTQHGRLAMSCLLVPPCRGSGPGTTLSGLSRVVPCHWARAAQQCMCRHWHNKCLTPQNNQNIKNNSFIISNLYNTDSKLQVQKTYQRLTLKVTRSHRNEILQLMTIDITLRSQKLTDHTKT
jgi:hypothetical protein